MVNAQIIKKYGNTKIGRNWNRMAELSQKKKRSQSEEAELNYRRSVQNYFAGNNGELPEDFVEVGDIPKRE